MICRLQERIAKGGGKKPARGKAASKPKAAKETANGDAEMTSRLRKVVEIDNAETGTVRLKKGADKLDEMALDTASTKTTRVRK